MTDSVDYKTVVENRNLRRKKLTANERAEKLGLDIATVLQMDIKDSKPDVAWEKRMLPCLCIGGVAIFALGYRIGARKGLMEGFSKGRVAGVFQAVEYGSLQ